MESRRALVSIIMNCLNGEKYLREAINSVYSQTYHDWEIIFWDNASSDNSAAIAKSYDKRLRYFRGPETVPLGAARNYALQKARGEFIAFLDCDDLWLPEKLEKQVPFFMDSEVGLVFSDCIQFNEAGETRVTYRHKKYYTGHCFTQLLTDSFLIMSTVMIRRAALSGQDTWFDPRFNMIEETDLFVRLAYRWKLAMAKEPLAKLRVHGDSWTWRQANLVAPEVEAMLEKYRLLFPDFQTRYHQVIALWETKIAIMRAKQQWKASTSREARRVLRPHVLQDKKAFILYFLTYLPEPQVSWLIARWQKHIIPATVQAPSAVEGKTF